MKASQLPFLVAVHRALGLTPSRFQALGNVFGSDWKAVWKASAADLQQTDLPLKAIDQLIRERARIDPPQLLAALTQCGAKVLVWGEKDYPRPLETIGSPPMVLFCRGNLAEEDFPSLSVVGARAITDYGKRATDIIVGELTRAGITIVSGMAMGVDFQAHKATLEAGGRTIGVLGNGIDGIYPKYSEAFALEALEAGNLVLLSEYFPGEEARPNYFPVRNRIVAGLSKATILIEAAKKSGSLITAGMALEQGKDVFAVPGSIFAPQSEGTNHLIFDGGAHPALSGEYIIQALGLGKTLHQKRAQKLFPEEGLEADVLGLFQNDESLSTDELLRRAEFPPQTVSATLSLLEIKGLVRHLGGQIYAKNI